MASPPVDREFPILSGLGVYGFMGGMAAALFTWSAWPLLLGACLFVGTAGLAAALSGRRESRAREVVPDCLVCGTRMKPFRRESFRCPSCRAVSGPERDA